MNKDGFWWDIKQIVYEPEFSNLKGKSDQGNTVGGGSAVNTISSLFVILLSVIVSKLLPMRRSNLVSRTFVTKGNEGSGRPKLMLYKLQDAKYPYSYYIRLNRAPDVGNVSSLSPILVSRLLSQVNTV